MAVLLLFLGVVLIGLTWRQAWRQAVEEEKTNNQMHLYLKLGERISALEAAVSDIRVVHKEPEFTEKDTMLGGLDYKMELLLRAVSGLEDRITVVGEIEEEEEPEEIDDGQLDFSTYLKEATQEDEFKSINQAYLSGKTVTEIAQQFGRGKGEVELILNLQK